MIHERPDADRQNSRLEYLLRHEKRFCERLKEIRKTIAMIFKQSSESGNIFF